MRLITKIKRFTSHTLEPQIDANTYKRQQIFKTIQAQSNPYLIGHYDLAGFQQYKAKNTNSHFKPLISNPLLSVSSIGIGTYKGSLDSKDDLIMFNAIIDSLDSGCNVLDTCRNFRGGRSQIIAGLALRYLINNQNYSRSSFFIASKAGYVRQTVPKGVPVQDIVNDNCVHPQFLASQLEISLKSLGVKQLDVYYLNNFAQCHKKEISAQIFEKRLLKAFQFLQNARAKGKIKNYGLSSWQSFRLPSSAPGHLDIQKVVAAAEKVGGKNHGFKFVQLPINILMPEAFADQYKNKKSFLNVAESLKLNVISNSPLLSGSLINVPMPAALLKCNNNGAKHLQLVRSVPSSALVSTLIGQKTNRHVRKNLEVLSVPALDEEQWLSVFVPSAEGKKPQTQEQVRQQL